MSKFLAVLLVTSMPAWAVPLLDIEKTTNGPTNSNATAPDYDNEDSAFGAGVPRLIAGTPVTWTYMVTNTGDTPFAAAQLSIADDNGTPDNPSDDFSLGNGQITFFMVQGGDADTMLEPGESWLYQANGTVMPGTYENRATVSAPQVPGSQGDSDLSHYEGIALRPGIDLEKTTNGPTNSNATAPDYDNEDSAFGAGVPRLIAGTPVTWTYMVTNTGEIPFAFGNVIVEDDNGTPGTPADDMTTANGQITFFMVQGGDADTMLEPGESWLYQANGTVHPGTYENRGTVTAGTAQNSDLSHYTAPGTIPQPATFWLLAIGGVGAALVRRRRHA